MNRPIPFKMNDTECRKHFLPSQVKLVITSFNKRKGVKPVKTLSLIGSGHIYIRDAPMCSLGTSEVEHVRSLECFLQQAVDWSPTDWVHETGVDLTHKTIQDKTATVRWINPMPDSLKAALVQQHKELILQKAEEILETCRKDIREGQEATKRAAVRKQKSDIETLARRLRGCRRLSENAAKSMGDLALILHDTDADGSVVLAKLRSGLEDILSGSRDYQKGWDDAMHEKSIEMNIWRPYRSPWGER